MCTGSAGACPADSFASSSTSCPGASQGEACDNDAADHCSGTSNTCVDVFEPASHTCRPSAGQCDVAEMCTGSAGASQAGACDNDAADHCSGTSNTCVDVFEPATTTCRPSAGQCDVAEMCTGSGPDCPTDSFEPNGFDCDDGNMCNGISTCQSGTCTQTTPPVTCTASDVCHDAGTCNPSTGVCSNPAKTDGAGGGDGNMCNGIRTCQSGTCTQTPPPVTCTASDVCHNAGTCNPSTGVCSNPA